MSDLLGFLLGLLGPAYLVMSWAIGIFIVGVLPVFALVGVVMRIKNGPKEFH